MMLTDNVGNNGGVRFAPFVVSPLDLMAIEP
jgi:hypothetical protein